MKKFFCVLNLLVSFCLASFAQKNKTEFIQGKVDSLKKIVNNLKGKEKVDCLNNIAYGLWWVLDEDTSLLHESCIYAAQAFKEAGALGYKQGLGYAYLQLEDCEAGRADTNRSIGSHFARAESYAKQAIQTGESLNDHLMIGASCRTLVWLEKWKGNIMNAKTYLQKAISAYEKTTGEELIGPFWEPDSVNCPGCRGNEEILGNLHKDLSAVCVKENDVVTAKQQMNLAIACFEKVNDNLKLGELYSSMSQFYFLRHEYKISEENSKKSIYYYQLGEDTLDQVRVCTQFCVVYAITGDFEKGLEYSKKAISLVEKLEGNPPKERGRSEGQAFFWMSLIYTIAGDYETAFNIIQRGHDYYAPDDSVGTWFWSSQMGNLYRLMGNYDSAMYYLGHFAKATPDANNTGISSLGYLYINLKQYDKALQAVMPDIEYLRKMNIIMPPLENGLMVAANAYLGKGKYREALQYAREAQRDLEIMNGKVGMIDNYKLLSDIFNKSGNKDSAYFYLSQYSILKDSLLNRQFYFRLNNYKKEAEEQKKLSQINLLNKENQLKDQRLKQQAIVRNGLVGGFILLFLLALFVFRNLSLKRKKERSELEKKTTELEVQALRAQMNPHFIFNCLNAINRFIFINEPRAASDYLTRFSRLIRMVLLHSQKKLVPLEDELEMLRLYLDMERLRFKNNFDYSIKTTNAVETNPIFIPPLLLQPFCENAIWHGLMHKDGQGHLDIDMNEDGGILHCSITDNGIGREKAGAYRSKSAEKEKSLGLKITKERLSLLNQGSTGGTFYEMEDIINEHGYVAGTRVRLEIRYKESVEEIFE